jgi:hypothetical protein
MTAFEAAYTKTRKIVLLMNDLVKWKTGRRRHKKANAEQQAAFKKTSGP